MSCPEIKPAFTTCGKPSLENLQYNSPIQIYDDKTMDEMVRITERPDCSLCEQVRIMDGPGAVVAGGTGKLGPAAGEPAVVTRMGWAVRPAASQQVNGIKET